jgi:hypothetical protein
VKIREQRLRLFDVQALVDHHALRWGTKVESRCRRDVDRAGSYPAAPLVEARVPPRARTQRVAELST